MTYDYLKKLPVSERPKMISLWGKEYFYDWKNVLWLIVFSLPGNFSVLWNGLILNRWKWALFGLVVSNFILVSIFVSVCSGMASSNWGTYFREIEPISYWIQVSLMALSYTFIVTIMWIGK